MAFLCCFLRPKDLDCYEAIEESYTSTLEGKGFLANGKYHPALDTLVPRLSQPMLLLLGFRVHGFISV